MLCYLVYVCYYFKVKPQSCACVCAVGSVAFYCLDTYNTGSLHYAEMFNFYKLLFGDGLDDDSVLQLAAAAILRGSSDIAHPVGVTFEDFDQAGFTTNS